MDERAEYGIVWTSAVHRVFYRNCPSANIARKSQRDFHPIPPWRKISTEQGTWGLLAEAVVSLGDEDEDDGLEEGRRRAAEEEGESHGQGQLPTYGKVRPDFFSLGVIVIVLCCVFFFPVYVRTCIA